MVRDRARVHYCHSVIRLRVLLYVPMFNSKHLTLTLVSIHVNTNANITLTKGMPKTELVRASCKHRRRDVQGYRWQRGTGTMYMYIFILLKL